MWRTERRKVSNSYSVNSPKTFGWLTGNIFGQRFKTWQLSLLVSLAILSGCKQESLYSALDETQANEVQAALLQAEIAASKQVSDDGEHWMVTVDKESIPAAMAVLTERGLPRASRRSIGDIFEKKGFVSSPLEERARYLYALSQELSGTLMEIDGVISSRVHVALPEEQILDNNRTSASVSVVLIQEPGVDLSPYETDIKAIVTDGIEGLDDVNRVTVKFFNRRESPPLPDKPILDNQLTLDFWMIWAAAGSMLALLVSAVFATLYIQRSGTQELANGNIEGSTSL